MIIPFIGLIFAWIMVPFGLPKTLESYSGDNQDMKAASKTLFGLGLAQMILFSISFLYVVGIITGVAGLVIWIIYWVKVVSFRDTFLGNPIIAEPKHD